MGLVVHWRVGAVHHLRAQRECDLSSIRMLRGGVSIIVWNEFKIEADSVSRCECVDSKCVENSDQIENSCSGLNRHLIRRVFSGEETQVWTKILAIAQLANFGG